MKKILITGSLGLYRVLYRRRSPAPWAGDLGRGAPHQFAPLPPGRPCPSPHAGPPGTPRGSWTSSVPIASTISSMPPGHEVSGPRRLLPCQPRRHAPPLPGRPGAGDARGAHRLPVEPQRLWRHPRDPAPYTPITEADQPRPNTCYGQSKLEAEQAALESGLPVVILRPTGVYGPGSTTTS